MVKEKRGGWVLEGLSIPVRSQWRLEAAGEGEGLVFGPRGRLGQSFWDDVGTGPRFFLPALAANLPTYMTCRRQPRDQTRAFPRRAWSVAHGRDDGRVARPCCVQTSKWLADHFWPLWKLEVVALYTPRAAFLPAAPRARAGGKGRLPGAGRGCGDNVARSGHRSSASWSSSSTVRTREGGDPPCGCACCSGVLGLEAPGIGGGWG